MVIANLRITAITTQHKTNILPSCPRFWARRPLWRFQLTVWVPRLSQVCPITWPFLICSSFHKMHFTW